MIVDLAEDSEREALPAYDVCIVGSGPAGGVVAAELCDSGLAICVLESGRRRVSAYGDELKRVHSAGIHVKDYSRERVFGGASTTWAGLSSHFDAIDLAPREWLADSGWPLERSELLALYEEAAERYRFPRAALFGPDGFEELRGRGGLAPEWAELDEKVFLACDEPQDFGRELRAVYAERGVDLYFDATVTDLEVEPGARRVRAARVRTEDGRSLRLEAGAFVVATGGIETARLLLNSRGGCPQGLGNEHDQVGRWFMNHPKNYHGILHLKEPLEDVPYFFGCLFRGYAGYAGLRLPESVQAAKGLLNTYVRMEPLFPWSDSQGVEALVLFAKKSAFVLRSFKRSRKGDVVTLRDYAETGDDSELQNARKTFGSWLGLIGTILADLPRVGRYLWYRLIARAKPKIRRVRIRNFMEMEPDPENRVELADETDRFGQPLPFARHRPTERDKRTLCELHAALAREVERLGLGRFETELASADPWPIDQDASHHMGTARMGTDPRRSVVDPDLRVHSLDNVWISGAAVFPTSGCANPTFTIVALAIRLARHLRSVLRPAEARR